MMGSLWMALLLLPVLATNGHRPGVTTCNKTKLRTSRDINVETFQGRWYVYNHTEIYIPILYVDFDFKGSDNFVYTVTASDALDCNQMSYEMRKDGPKNHFVNTRGGKRMDFYFTDVDPCKSTFIAYITATKGTSTRSTSVYEYVGLLVRNPNAAPNSAMVGKLKTELCPDDDVDTWNRAANNRTCPCSA